MLFSLQVIAAEGEQKASRALREAADVISQSPSALQVLYCNNVSTKKCDTRGGKQLTLE